jgi:hypothetical protein
MKNKSFGIPLFGATLTFALPDNSTAAFPALWGPTGSVIPQFSAEDFDSVGARLKAIGKGTSMTARITLDDDPGVSADIELDKHGFVPVGDALAQWVRRTHPDDCAYLDEVLYPATLYWRTPDGVMRMPAHWVNTGEVRPRPASELLNTVMELRWAIPAGTQDIATIVLCADPTIAAMVCTDEDNDLVAPSFAFDAWLKTAQVAA